MKYAVLALVDAESFTDARRAIVRELERERDRKDRADHDRIEDAGADIHALVDAFAACQAGGQMRANALGCAWLLAACRTPQDATSVLAAWARQLGEWSQDDWDGPKPAARPAGPRIDAL